MAGRIRACAAGLATAAALVAPVGAAPSGPGGTALALSQVRMLSGSFGLAVQNYPFTLLETENGGVSWRVVAGPRPRDQFDNWGFAGPDGAWIQAGPPLSGGGLPPGHRPSTLYLVAASRWQAEPVPPRVQTVVRVAGGAVVGDSLHARQRLALYETVAGGGWRTVETNLGALDAAGNPELRSVVFATAAVAFATGFMPSTGWYMYRSVDGGVRWAPEALPPVHDGPGNQAPVGAPVFCSGTVGYLPVMLMTAGRPAHELYATTDAGATWRRLLRTAAAPVVACTLGGQGYVVAGATVYLAANAGLEALPAPSSQSLTVVDVVSRSRWLLTGDGGRRLYETTDGGRHVFLLAATLPG